MEKHVDLDVIYKLKRLPHKKLFHAGKHGSECPQCT